MALALWPVRGLIVEGLVKPLTWFELGRVDWLAVGLGEVFILDMKVVLGCALAVVLPYALWEIYHFISPGLYKREKRAVRLVVTVAPLVSAAGGVLAWAFLAPTAATFLLGFGHKGLVVMPRLGDYIGLVLGMAVGAVLLLHLPLLVLVLVRAGFVSFEAVQAARKWVFLFVLVASAVVTPPDPLSMLLLAIPVVLWWETVLWWARRG